MSERLRPFVAAFLEKTKTNQTALAKLVRGHGVSWGQSGASNFMNRKSNPSYPVALALCKVIGIDPGMIGLTEGAPDEVIRRELRRPFAEVKAWFFHTPPVVEAFAERDDYTVEDLLALHATPHIERGLTVEKVHGFVAEHRAGVLDSSEEIADPEGEIERAGGPKLLPPAPTSQPNRLRRRKKT